MNQTICQWIARAQEGEEEAILLILQQFRPLICKYARRHRYCYDSLDEAVSVAQLAILECVHAFDVTCGDEAHKAFRRAVDRVFKRESRRFKTYMEKIETALHIDEIAEALRTDPLATSRTRIGRPWCLRCKELVQQVSEQPDGRRTTISPTALPARPDLSATSPDAAACPCRRLIS